MDKALDITGIVTEIKNFATHDGPGIRTTVFLKGCPLRCKWCSSPETWKRSLDLYYHARKCHNSSQCVQACPEKVISMDKDRKIDRQKCSLCMKCADACGYQALVKVGRVFTIEEIMKKIEADRPFYDRSGGGVTLSGGEPLFQADFAIELFKTCRERSIHTCLDTCGYADPEIVEGILKYTKLILLDIKIMDPDKHKEWTGVTNERILNNAKLMTKYCETRISLPLIPEFNDSAENIRKTAEFASSIGMDSIDVEPYHKLGEGKYLALGMESPYPAFGELTEAKINEGIRIIESYGLKTTRGRSV